MKRIWAKIYIGDTLSAAQGMSAVEFGIYTRFVLYYWQHGMLKQCSSTCSRIAQAYTQEEQAAVEKVLLEHFYIKDGAYHNDDFDAQIAECDEQLTNASNRGRSGAKARWEKQKLQAETSSVDAQAYAQALPEQCESESESDNITLSIDKDNINISSDGKACEPADIASSQKKKPKTSKKPKLDEPILLPSWLPQDRWDAFVANRKAIKKPIGYEAQKIALRELTKLVDAGENAVERIEASILHNWQTFYPSKNQNNGGGAQAHNGKAVSSGYRAKSTHMNFNEIDYDKGVGPNGEF